MKYIRLYDNYLFKYENAHLKCSYNDGTNGGKQISKNFSGPNGIYKSSKYAKEIIEEHEKFNEELGFITITTRSDSIQVYSELIKWYGNCNWKEMAEKDIKNVFIYNKYLYGLEAAYDKYIANSKNVINIVKYIKENQPDMWKILSFHDPSIEKGAEMGKMGFSDD